MKVDEGAYFLLKSAMGAFSCKVPPLPKTWDPAARPHIANLVYFDHSVFRVYLSTPKRLSGTMKYDLLVFDLNSLPSGSIIEIRYDNAEYGYYRKDDSIWTKVAESRDVFTVEVYSHSTSPIILDSINASE